MLKIHKTGDANIVRQAKKDVKKMKAEEKAEEEAEAERTLDVGAPKKKIIMIKKKKKFIMIKKKN